MGGTQFIASATQLGSWGDGETGRRDVRRGTWDEAGGRETWDGRRVCRLASHVRKRRVSRLASHVRIRLAEQYYAKARACARNFWLLAFWAEPWPRSFGTKIPNGIFVLSWRAARGLRLRPFNMRMFLPIA